MLDILGKYGVPAHLIRLIAMLHTNVRVKLTVGGVEVVFDSTVGVKQGDNMAPVLFLFVNCDSGCHGDIGANSRGARVATAALLHCAR